MRKAKDWMELRKITTLLIFFYLTAMIETKITMVFVLCTTFRHVKCGKNSKKVEVTSKEEVFAIVYTETEYQRHCYQVVAICNEIT